VLYIIHYQLDSCTTFCSIAERISFDRLIAAGCLPSFFCTADIAYTYYISCTIHSIVFMCIEYVLFLCTESFFWGNRTGKNVFSKRKKICNGAFKYIYICTYIISYRGRIRQWRNTPGRGARSRRWDVWLYRGRGLLQWPEIQVPRAAAAVAVARGFGSGAAKGYIRFRLTRIRDGLERTRDGNGLKRVEGGCTRTEAVARSYSRRGWSGRVDGRGGWRPSLDRENWVKEKAAKKKK